MRAVRRVDNQQLAAPLAHVLYSPDVCCSPEVVGRSDKRGLRARESVKSPFVVARSRRRRNPAGFARRKRKQFYAGELCPRACRTVSELWRDGIAFCRQKRGFYAHACAAHEKPRLFHAVVLRRLLLGGSHRFCREQAVLVVLALVEGIDFSLVPGHAKRPESRKRRCRFLYRIAAKARRDGGFFRLERLFWLTFTRAERGLKLVVHCP